MPALFIFLLKVNAALLLFCAGYYLALRRLTFYTLNRVYLVTAILFASVYPEINLSDFVQHNRELTKPVQMVIVNWQAPAEKLIKPAALQSYWQWIEVAFWTGVVLLSIKLIVQLFSLFKLYRNSAAGQIYGHKVRIIKGNAGPFSFWKSIFVNPGNHQSADLKAILLHEQVHVNEWHTLDILLAELSTIFYWFNPRIWLMKKAIRENIEFITDRKILNKGADSKQYQYSLVNVSFAANSNSLVNHFNISTIKKRIIMMNAKRSSKLNLTRYAFLVPAVIVLLLVFTISKAVPGKTNGHFRRYLSGILKEAVGIKQNKPLLPVINTSKIRVENAQTADTNHVPTTAQKVVRPLTAADTALLIKKSLIGIDNPVIYVVDGKVIDTTEKLKPDDIDSMAITKNKQYTMLYIYTKNRAIKGVTLTGKITNLSVSATNGMDTNRISKVRIDEVDYKAGTGKITNSQLNYIDTTRDTLMNAKLKHNLKLTQVTVMGFKTKKTPLYNSSISFNNAFSLNHLSDKLIIIDGKTASEKDLKKLSAFE
jgi:hypothetical protein